MSSANGSRRPRKLSRGGWRSIMSEYSASAPVPPPAYLHVFDTAEFKRFEEALETAGWQAVTDASLAEVVSDMRTYRYPKSATGVDTILQVWDMLNAVGVELRSEH